MDRNIVKGAAIALLGPPTFKSANELRWGRHGSLSISLEPGKLGHWFDHQAGHGGGFYSLIARQMGFTDKADAIAWAEHRLGLLPILNVPSASSQRNSRHTTQRNSGKAMQIWEQAVPLSGTPGENYLRKRCIDGPGHHCVRFHPCCPVKLSNEQQSRQPALISLFRDVKSDAPVAILRTFLKPDGFEKSDHPLLKNQKQMLGPTTGAAIKITPDEDVTGGLVIAEGLETALSVAASGWVPVWALGCAGSIASFAPLPGIQALTIMADADLTGIEAAKKCAHHWVMSGAEATVLVPKRGGDWNDWIAEKT